MMRLVQRALLVVALGLGFAEGRAGMSVLRMIYLALAVLGAVLWVISPVVWVASAPGWDLLVAALALMVWTLAETWVRRNWLALVVLPVTFGVGLGCGLPLYLFLRTRRVD